TGLRALIAAGRFIELLLRNQVVIEHLTGARVLVVRIEEIGFSALHGSDFLGIRWGRFIGTNAELRTNLAHQSALTVHFELELLGIEDDQRLVLAYGVAYVREHLRHAAFHLRAQRAFFQRSEEHTSELQSL